MIQHFNLNKIRTMKMQKLSSTEKEVLGFLSLGYRPNEIRHYMSKADDDGPEQPMSKAHFYSVCGKIRKKTGIRSTKDRVECSLVLEKINVSEETPDSPIDPMNDPAF